jgi:predicted nuclease with RNAse H fold
VTAWAGVDVGGRRKGFHAAVVDETCLVAGPARLATSAAAVAWLERHKPALVAVDSPRAPAPDGLRSRPEERALAAAICGIRYTPEAAELNGNAYYAWITHGLELYTALDAAGLLAIECFPTASWTRWAGARGTTSRARWSSAALAASALAGVPERIGQDGRDAIGAALTARCRDRGRWEAFGPIVVPA